MKLDTLYRSILERTYKVYHDYCRDSCKSESLEEIEISLASRELKELTSCMTCIVKEVLTSLNVPFMIVNSLKEEIHEIYFLEDAIIDIAPDSGLIVYKDEIDEYLDTLKEFRVYRSKDLEKIEHMIMMVTKG